MRTHRSIAWSLLLVSVGAACSDSAQTDSTRAKPDMCASFNGTGNNKISGSLADASTNLNLRRRARGVAMKIGVLPTELKRHDEPAGAVYLIPLCENHDLTEDQLREGRFVALITGPGTAPRYSAMPDDVVYWWMYGTQSSTGATIWHSEFLSAKVRDNEDAIRKAPSTEVCETTNPATTEIVHWHAATCPPPPQPGAAMIQPSGDNPWFGCKLGCCFAVKPLDES